MTKKVLRTVTIVLCAAIIALFALPTLSACNDAKEAIYYNGLSDALDFKEDGNYTATVSVEGTTFPKNLSAGDVTVEYPDSELQSNDDIEAAEDFNTGGYVVSGDTQGDGSSTHLATVSSVYRKDEHTIEISFTDSTAAVNKPIAYTYTIVTETKKGRVRKAVVAGSPVKYPQFNVTTNVSEVSSLAKELTLTLTIDDGEYKSGITKDDVRLTGAFKKLEIASISSANKNLTLQLTGDMYRDETAGVYHNGGVAIAADKVDGCKEDVEASIPIEDVAVFMNASGLKIVNGLASIPVYLSGHSFADGVSAGDFVFKQVVDKQADEWTYAELDGVSVKGFERKDASSGILTVKVEGATDENGIVARLNDSLFTVSGQAINSNKDLSWTVDLAPASVYAIFDYAELAGDKYNFTLILNAINGTFAQTLDKSAISFSFGEDFAEEATLVSLERTGDKTAELKLTLPALQDEKGQYVPVEEMYLKGKIELAAGTMISRWGTPADKVEFERAYDYAGMGRWTIFDTAIDAVKGAATSVADTLTSVNWGAVYDVGSQIFSGVGTVITVLEFLGVIESVKAKCDKIYAYLQKMTEQLLALSAQIEDLAREDRERTISTFCKDKLAMLKEYNGYAVAAVRDAAATLKKRGVTEPTSSLENASEMVRSQWTDYISQVFALARQTDSSTFDKLLEYYTAVCSEVLATTGGKSIFILFDEYVADYFNFDVQGYDDRDEFQETLRFEIANAYHLLCMYNQFGVETPKQNTINTITKQYDNFTKFYDENKLKRREGTTFYMYAFQKEVSLELKLSYNGKKPITHYNDQCRYITQRLHGHTIEEELKSLLNYEYKEGSTIFNYYSGLGTSYSALDSNDLNGWCDHYLTWCSFDSNTSKSKYWTFYSDRVNLKSTEVTKGPQDDGYDADSQSASGLHGKAVRAIFFAEVK